MNTNVFKPTNLSAMNIFDIAESSTINSYLDNDTSYLVEAIRFVEESNREFSEYKNNLYKSILESKGDSDIIHESFADFFAAARKLIDKFLDLIKRLFMKFSTKFHSIYKGEKYLVKHKNDFTKFNSNHEFNFEGYNFTIDPSIPIIHAEDNFREELDQLKINDFSKASEEVSNIYNALVDKLKNGWYDSFRGQVIGSEEMIDDSDFSKELFAVYRGDSSDKETIEVNSSYITDIYNRFVSYDKTESSIKKTKDNIDKEYNAIKKSINQISAKKYSTDMEKIVSAINIINPSETIKDADKVVAIIDSFFKAKFDQVQMMANIHALAFSAKLEAIKDCFNQDKAVLYKALYKIQGTVKKEDVHEWPEHHHEDPKDCPVCADNDPKEDLDDNGWDKSDKDIPASDRDDYDDKSEDNSPDDNYPDMEDEFIEFKKEFDDLSNDITGIDSVEQTEKVNEAVNSSSITGLVLAEKAATGKTKVSERVIKAKVDKLSDDKINHLIDKYSAKIKSRNVPHEDKEICNLWLKCLYAKKKTKKKVAKESSNIIDDYTIANVYNYSLIERAISNDQTDRIIKECLVFGESKSAEDVMKELNLLNEGVGDSIKAGFVKAKDFLIKIWNKFVEKMTALVASDKTYLTKYKDTILKKQPKDATYTMKDYPAGIANITSTPIPVFNYTSLKPQLADDITFQKFLVKGKNPPLGDNQEFVDYCKDLFTGGPEKKEIKASALNMTDIYNYCLNYNSMKDQLQKDLNTIEKAANDADRVITGIESKAPKKESTDLFKEETVYSELYGALTEADVERKVDDNTPDSKPTTPSSTTNTSTPDNTNVAKNLNSVDDKNKEKEEDLEKAASGELKEAKDCINRYLKNSTTLMTAKMTAAEEIYKSYMSIIRFHVNDNISGETGGAKVAQKATEYTGEGKKAAIELVGNEDQIKKMGLETAVSTAEEKGKQAGKSSSIIDSAKSFIQSLFN